MTKTDIAKKAVRIVVGFGTAKIVSSIIQNNTDPETVTDQVAITGASVVVGMMAADATDAYTAAKIDELIAWWNANVTKNA